MTDAQRSSRQGQKGFMPVIARFCGIVIRLLSLQSLGPRLHAFYGDSELVLDLKSLRIIDGSFAEETKQMVLAWAKAHQRDLLAGVWRAV